jgi:hypothetical protein
VLCPFGDRPSVDFLKEPKVNSARHSGAGLRFGRHFPATAATASCYRILAWPPFEPSDPAHLRHGLKMATDSNLPGPPKSQSWWTTLPGMLTGLAAAITAVTGLIVALHQAGIMRGWGGGSPAGTVAHSASTTTSSQPGRSAPRSDHAAEGSVSFPSNGEIQIGEGSDRLLFKVLSGGIEERSNDTLALRLKLRVSNYTRFPVFCGSSMRLLVDEVPRAPVAVTHFDTPIESASAQDGEAVFELPPGAHHVAFMVVDPRNSSGDTYKLPLDLPPPKP